MDRFEELREKVVPLLKPYVTRVAVFGSFAHGEDTPDSDIDLLVALKPSGERSPLGRLVRLVGRDRAAFRAQGGLSYGGRA